MHNDIGERLVRMKEARKIVGLGRSTIYKLIAEERFPKPVAPFGLRNDEPRLISVGPRDRPDGEGHSVPAFRNFKSGSPPGSPNRAA